MNKPSPPTHGPGDSRAMHLTRRQFSVASLALAGASAGPALAKDSALPVPASLPMAALLAKAKSEPLVILVTLSGCPFCELVRRSYLLPARADSGLQAWQLDVLDKTTPLVGFNTQLTTAALQTQAWKASFTPTVLFLGAQGQELAERLIGIAVPDFYGAYLEQRLAIARRQLKHQS